MFGMGGLAGGLGAPGPLVRATSTEGERKIDDRGRAGD